MGPFPDPTQRQYQPLPPRQPSPAPQQPDDEDTQPKLRAVPPGATPARKEPYFWQEPAYQEHVTGSLAVPSSEAPRFRPAYQPYQAPPVQRPGSAQAGMPQQPFYPAYPGYGPAAPGAVPPASNGQHGYAYPYPYYPHYPGYYYPYWYPPKPRRDRYQLVVAITSFVGSILSILAGLLCLGFFLLTAIMPTIQRVRPDERFGSLMALLAFAIAGLVGGGFALYHSIRACFFHQKPSASFKLPWFWTFLLAYLLIVAVGVWQYFAKQAVTYPVLTGVLIILAAIFPAFTIMSLGLRRIHFPRRAQWPTTWRRFAVALVSGATLSIGLALALELLLSLLISRLLGVSMFALDNPDLSLPSDPQAILSLFLEVSVVAPLVEEAVKPLAVVVLIGRVRSAAEAFVLGMACGIGFNLVETTGYIGQGYGDWLNVALQRSGAGLLHGFGAGMVALGWYFMTHSQSTRKVNRVLLAFGCWCYAILQHALWNGSFGLQLLPAPVGTYLADGTIPLGSIQFPSFLLVYIIETILMLIFFLFVTKRLRAKNEEQKPPASVNVPDAPRMEQPGRAPQMAARAW